MNVSIIYFVIIVINLSIGGAQKLNLDVLNNYSEFLNYGEKKLHKSTNKLENAIFKSKLDVLGEMFKKSVQFFKVANQMDIVFLVDASSSVGDDNFKSELKFIKKLLSDITVDYNHTRVAVVTFSSPSDTIKNIDDIGDPSIEHNKCLFLNEQLMNIEYKGGETYTLKAFEKAKEIFDASHRNDSKKVIFLITDGYSNGDNPVPLSNQLKNEQVTVFTIGIRNGNYKELYELSSTPGEFYSYLLDSFEEFEGLARRALHVDLSSGDFIPLGISTPCDKLCETGDCCDEHAMCTCGTTSGHYSCTCQPGYYGSGLRDNCFPCKVGTYSDGANLCLPCPDVHHTTFPPANGIESCKCKKGYQADGNGGCQILKCSKIEAPEYGYIVKERECSNILNSACGIRCEVGYTLVGSSIRLCQANASWSGSDPTCEVKTCTQLFAPKHGSLTCEQTDLGVVYDQEEKNFPVDTVCKFSCGNGTFLMGSTDRTCLPIAQWDGLRTICKPIKCNKLPQVKYGRIEPESCVTGKQEFGKGCQIICNDGFEATGPTNKTCGDRGSWRRNHEESTLCIDVTPPHLVCPKNITVHSLPGVNYGQVSWKEPNITDNSGQNVSSWIKPAIINITDYKFTIGLTPITYFAEDIFNNAIKCRFFVEIIDREPPTIEGCIDPDPFLINPNEPEIITWDEPNIFDNSQNVSVNKSHEFGVFKLGTTLITYLAKDPSGNINVCNMNITVEESQCPDFVPPANSHSECQDQTNGIECVITCEEGYGIPLQVSSDNVSFICNHVDATWYYQEGLFPECSISVVANKSQKGILEIPLEEDGCDEINNTKIDNIKIDIKSSMCNGINDQCEVDISSECVVEKSEEETNKLITRRRKRHSKLNRRRYKKKRLNIKFEIRGNSNYTSDIKIRNTTVQIQPVKLDCSNGFISRKYRCVQCPRGTFHNISANLCQSCDFGYFNNKTAATACVQCPAHYSTRKMHVKSFSECRMMCPPGTHARRKKIKLQRQDNHSSAERLTLSPHCSSCPVGTYQPEYGMPNCRNCPSGYTTLKAHSTNFTDCFVIAEETCKIPNICNNGSCRIINEYHYTCDCLPGFYGSQCEYQRTLCDSQPCSNGGTCQSTIHYFNCTCPERFSGKYCENSVENEIVSCPLNCLNGGTCFDDGDGQPVCICSSGFSGHICENPLKSCDNVICENNSSCIDDGGSFKCICSKGFIGRRCNILPCDYKPCPEFSVCINLMVENATKETFKCVCPEGRTGPTCLDRINYCLNKPCENNGECISGDFDLTCKCSKLFYGSRCELRWDTNYILKFPHFDTNDYVILKGFPNNLTEITACLWMQSSDHFNYGTLLSYATKHNANTFTLTDYTGLVIYINNDYRVTDVFLNDGFWHHICAQWMSYNGVYRIYVDGKLVANGTNLANNTEIEGQGYLIIGQEQDVMGGKFSQSESFVGNMAYIDIWSKILTLEEIVEHQNDCSDSVFGDLYAWAEMQTHIKGNIERAESTFCQICDYPEPLYNGLITREDNKAFYSCYPGFELSSQQFLNGRRCTKTSRWEGFYEPHCNRISCGYPGPIKNGYLIGNGYLYADKISCKCYEGYNLVGNTEIICGADGQWYPEKPTCVGIQCTVPIILHGQVQIISDDDLQISNKVDLDTQIQIICNENATLIGTSIGACLEDGKFKFRNILEKHCIQLGTWDNMGVLCELNDLLKCALNLIPKAPIHGYIDEDSIKALKAGVADFVEYKCQPGYILKGINISTCIVDGYWSDPNVTCE